MALGLLSPVLTACSRPPCSAQERAVCTVVEGNVPLGGSQYKCLLRCLQVRGLLEVKEPTPRQSLLWMPSTARATPRYPFDSGRLGWASGLADHGLLGTMPALPKRQGQVRSQGRACRSATHLPLTQAPMLGEASLSRGPPPEDHVRPEASGRPLNLGGCSHCGAWWGGGGLIWGPAQDLPQTCSPQCL